MSSSWSCMVIAAHWKLLLCAVSISNSHPTYGHSDKDHESGRDRECHAPG